MFGVGGGILSHLSLAALLDTMEGKQEVAFALAVSNIGTGCGIIGVSCVAAYFTNVHHILTLDELFRYMSLLGVFVTLVAILVFSVISKKLETKTYESIPNESSNNAGGQTSQKLSTSDVEQPTSETSALISQAEQTTPKEQKFGWRLLFSREGFETKAVYLFISQIIGFAFTIIPFKFS